MISIMCSSKLVIRMIQLVLILTKKYDLRIPCSDNSIDNLKSSNSVADLEEPAVNSLAQPSRFSKERILPSAS